MNGWFGQLPHRNASKFTAGSWPLLLGDDNESLHFELPSFVILCLRPLKAFVAQRPHVENAKSGRATSNAQHTGK